MYKLPIPQARSVSSTSTEDFISSLVRITHEVVKRPILVLNITTALCATASLPNQNGVGIHQINEVLIRLLVAMQAVIIFNATRLLIIGPALPNELLPGEPDELLDWLFNPASNMSWSACARLHFRALMWWVALPISATMRLQKVWRH